MPRRALPLATAAAVSVLLVAAIVILGGHVAQGASDLVAASSSPPASEASEASGVTVVPVEPSTTTAVADENDDGVKRVVVVGDSLVVGAETELSATFEAQGVEYRFIAVSGTGLLTDQGVRLSELEDALDSFHPDVVVVESCCNYDGTYTLDDGTMVPSDSELLWTAWGVQAEKMVDAAEAHGAEVFFVITPRPLPDGSYAGIADRVEQFNDAYRSLGVGLIDWDTALYPDDTTVGLAELRQPDGLHLSGAGDAIVATATWTAIAGSFD